MTRIEPQPASLSELTIAADHPVYSGHFPDFPILPGAVLLDAALAEIARSRGIDITQWRIASAKFQGAVRPGDALTLEHTAPDGATVRFTVRSAARAVASGLLSRGA